MFDKKISVLIPCYNHSAYISHTIKSIINQSYENIEILVVDDKSTDNSFKTIKKFKDSRLKVYQNKQNLGTAKTLNRLLQLSKGDYIAFCGSDDLWKENKLEEQLRFIENHKSCEGVFSFIEVVDEGGNKNSNEKCNIDVNNNTFNKNFGSFKENFWNLFVEGNFLCHSSALISRKAINDTGLFNTFYRQLHDFDYWLRFCKNYNFEIIPIPLVEYRRANNNFSSVSAPIVKNNVRVLNEYSMIAYNFISNLSKQQFLRLFKDKIVTKKEITSVSLLCEKFFLLKKWGSLFYSSYFPALLFLDKIIKKNNVRSCLKNSYKMNLNDLYDFSGKLMIKYPLEYNPDYHELLNNNKIMSSHIKALEERINIYETSISWKLTTPVRFIGKILGRH